LEKTEYKIKMDQVETLVRQGDLKREKGFFEVYVNWRKQSIK
jgi:hypothetical protein